ncbi:MAG TPA: trypsin-like peptidase domain-containing protein [Chthoniobacterales bacterium]|nr:trypsin-like peptidase domain-containing protein [Chthoniobacterales bacterium]
MRQRSGSNLELALADRRISNRRVFSPAVLATGLALCAAFVRADEAAPPTAPAQLPESSTTSISREVKEIFEKSGKAVVKIRGTDEHGDLSGTGFFIDPTGMIYTAFSVGGDTDNLTVEFDGKTYPARLMMADLRSGIAILKADIASPALPIGKSETMEVATPVMAIGYPLDLPSTPSFGMVAGFDRKFLDRYFCTTHVRVNLPTQRGEAGAPLLNFKGEVVGILVAQIENGSACYALPIDAAEKIRNDFIRFGEARHGWIGINVAQAPKPIDGSTAEMTEIMKDTPAYGSGIKPGDILLQVGKTQVHQPEDVIDASFFLTAGDDVPITVMRGNEKMVFEVKADCHPLSPCAPKAATLTPAQGIPLQIDATRRTP